MGTVAESRTVRLYPLAPEHTLPMFVDVLIFIALIPGAAFGQWWFFVAALIVVAAHAVQMAWLVAVRFDDTAITIVRPWRRRRIPWDRIAGLIYTAEPTSRRGRDPYRLRLVLTDPPPPAGRYLAGADLAPYAGGPVVMTVYEPKPGLGGPREQRCRDQIFAELARHGITHPEPYALRLHLAGHTLEEEAYAAASDLLRHTQGFRPVTVNHPGPHGAEETHLIDTVIPGLAADHGARPDPKRTDRYSIYAFEGEEAAEEFVAAVRAIVPAGWPVTPTALPEPRPLQYVAPRKS